MDGYLKTRDDCMVCGQVFSHHRADDGPAWMTMLITGHVMAPLMITVYEIWEPNPGVMAAVFSLFFIALSLYLLPRLKGCFVGTQWAKRMYGFDSDAPPGPHTGAMTREGV
ncbi:DUF983 domain-containing protein [Paracoccaceae bacterium GXU_MW_L88]